MILNFKIENGVNGKFTKRYSDTYVKKLLKLLYIGRVILHLKMLKKHNKEMIEAMKILFLKCHSGGASTQATQPR